MPRILLFTYKPDLGRLLEDALQASGVKEVDLSTSTRETFTYLSRQRYDLAIIPAQDGNHRIQALRSIQPDLNIVLLVEAGGVRISSDLDKEVLGVLQPTHIESQIHLILARLDQVNDQEIIAEPNTDYRPTLGFGESFLEMCQDLQTDPGIIQLLWTTGSRVLACNGTLTAGQTQQIADRLSSSWDGQTRTAQIQYFETTGSNEIYVIYTRPLAEGLLTLVAEGKSSVADLRRQADELASKLASKGILELATTSGAAISAIGPVLVASQNAPVQGTAISLMAFDIPAAGPVLVASQNAPVQDTAISLIASDIPIEKQELLSSTKTPIEAADRGTRHVSDAGSVLLFWAGRLAFGLIVLLSIIFITYFGVNAARGMSFGEAAVVAIGDTVDYVSRLLQGDLGMTTAGSDSFLAIPVSQVIVERLPRSLALMGISLLAATIVGLGLGISAARRGNKRSLGIIIATIIGISVPSFFAAFLLQLGVITLTRQTGRPWLPVGGWGWDAHLILPVLVLAARPLAQITRVTFVSVRDVLDQDYVRTAYSKGLRRMQVMGGHVLRNAAVPIMVTIGVSLSFILGSLPVVELYFGIPGIGFTLLGAIAKQDDDLAVALLLCLGILFLVVQFLLDFGKRFVDPRSSETPAYLVSKRSRNPLESIKTLAADAGDYLTDNAITRWSKNRFFKQDEVSIGPVMARTQSQLERVELAAQPSHRRVGWSAAYRNVPLVVGSILMIVLLVVVLFGAYLAPHSPYTTQGLVIEGGEFSTPPFAPSEQYPWGTDVLGRDMTSLILTGAQLTLSLVLLAVVVRMGTGILLGATAGWRTGSLFDRLTMGTAEIIAAYPNVLLAMLIILALGIRQGLWPFIIGIAVVGWGGTMQFVRGEVAAIRSRAFIESAVATGARTPRIISKHIMPNLFSPLIAIFALEMGAVLMLLGELGFLSIFIGGGAFAQLETFAAPFHYSDVPEWGALLSNIRTYSRSYPWLAIFPTLAFFIAILAFNLFGEGIRRLVDDGSIIINRLVNRYTIAVAAIGLLFFIWMRANSGPVAFYRQHAEAYDGLQAEANVADLTAPVMEGRSLGTSGMDEAAHYIADQFEEMGLQPAGEQLTFFQERFRSFERLDSVPELVIGDGGADPVYGQDFAAYPGRFMSLGEMSGPVRVIGLGDPLPIRGFGASQRYRELRTADFSDEILLALSAQQALDLQRVPHGGLLVVVDDPDLLERRFTLSGLSQISMNSMTGRESGQETPSLWITEEMADRLLAGTGKTVAGLRDEVTQLELGEVSQLPLDVRVDMVVEGTLEERWPVQNVIGHMPGMAATPGESQMDQQVILVLAQYDSPPPSPEDIEYPGANDNASGVAVMVEAIRVMQETEYVPNRTFLFVAYSGEGLEGGENVSDPDITRFLQAKVGFAANLEPEAIIHVQGVGGGSGDRLEVSAGGSMRLAELFESASRKMGANVTRSDDPIDISIIYQEGSPFDSGQDAPEVRLSWEGWAEDARLPSDTMNNISADNLEDAGRTLALALMIMGRERQY